MPTPTPRVSTRPKLKIFIVDLTSLGDTCDALILLGSSLVGQCWNDGALRHILHRCTVALCQPRNHRSDMPLARLVMIEQSCWQAAQAFHQKRPSCSVDARL